jgi:hypothetical protein
VENLALKMPMEQHFSFQRFRKAPAGKPMIEL